MIEDKPFTNSEVLAELVSAQHKLKAARDRIDDLTRKYKSCREKGSRRDYRAQQDAKIIDGLKAKVIQRDEEIDKLNEVTQELITQHKQHVRDRLVHTNLVAENEPPAISSSSDDQDARRSKSIARHYNRRGS